MGNKCYMKGCHRQNQVLQKLIFYDLNILTLVYAVLINYNFLKVESVDKYILW